MIKRWLVILGLALTVFVGWMMTNKNGRNFVSFVVDKGETVLENNNGKVAVSNHAQFIFLKDVGEARLDNFGLTQEDFQLMKDSGAEIIESNFDICADEEDVNYFLDQSRRFGLKVVMPAGAGEAEWGYACDQDEFPENQKPVWQKKQVAEWVNKWKSHPAIYAWDISNEAGSTFPNASMTEGKLAKDYYLSADQLKTAYVEVKALDPGRMVMIRMNGWFFYDYDDNFFRIGNPFVVGMADIVMVNAYSNVEEYFDDFVATVVSRAKSSIYRLSPETKLVVALGAWKEPPIWVLPNEAHLKTEIETVRDHLDVLGIAYFKYGARGSEWYWPEDAVGLWKLIRTE